MAGDLYLVGSCPFDTSEEVFRALGPKLGQWLPFIPDGEVGDRTYWINQIAYNVYNGHPDIETIQRPMTKDGVEAFQDRQIDVFTMGCLDPCAALQQLTATSKIRFLGVNSKAALTATPPLKAFFDRLGPTEGVIKKGIYGKNQVNEGDVWTNSAILGVTARKGLPDDVVYNMTKAFWTNLDGIRKTAPYMNAVTLQFAAQKANMTFHPGAEKFYKEAGVWKR